MIRRNLLKSVFAFLFSPFIVIKTWGKTKIPNEQMPQQLKNIHIYYSKKDQKLPFDVSPPLSIFIQEKDDEWVVLFPKKGRIVRYCDNQTTEEIVWGGEEKMHPNAK